MVSNPCVERFPKENLTRPQPLSIYSPKDSSMRAMAQRRGLVLTELYSTAKPKLKFEASPGEEMWLGGASFLPYNLRWKLKVE